MKMELTHSMASVVEEIVGLTPDEIRNMSIEEINKHTKSARKKNRLFHNFFSIPLFAKKKKYEFSQNMPRGSMIAAHHRFTFREDTNRKIMKMK